MADENYIDLYYDSDEETMTEQEGLELHGKDGVFCTSPMYTHIPLLTENQDVAGAINELKKSLAEGGGDIEELWEPPEDWIPVPEPGEYEMYFLIEPAAGGQLRIKINFPEGYTGDDILFVDWGNGETYDYSGESYTWFYYTYATAGQYLVKITLSHVNRHFVGIVYDTANVLIAKLGSGIKLNCENSYGDSYRYGFRNQKYLRYVVINGTDGLPPYQTGQTGGAFQYCHRLKRVDMATPAKVIPAYCFAGCFSLINFDFSAIEEINSYGFSGCTFRKLILPQCTSIVKTSMASECLIEFSAPLLTAINDDFEYTPNLKTVNLQSCTSIGADCFKNSYRLTELTVAEGCTIDSTSVTNAYNLEEIKYYKETD